MAAAVAPLEARAEQLHRSIRALETSAQALRLEIEDARLRAQAEFFGKTEGCRLTNRFTGQTGTVALMTPKGSINRALVLIPDGQKQADAGRSLVAELRLGEWLREGELTATPDQADPQRPDRQV